MGLFQGFVFYTNWGVSPGAAGTTHGFLIFIRPQHKEDRGILEHERVHVRQWWRQGGIGHVLLKLWDRKKWVLRFEVEAFREQLKWYADDRTEVFSRALATRYNLGITYETALALLKG